MILKYRYRSNKTENKEEVLPNYVGFRVVDQVKFYLVVQEGSLNLSYQRENFSAEYCEGINLDACDQCYILNNEGKTIERLI